MHVGDKIFTGLVVIVTLLLAEEKCTNIRIFNLYGFMRMPFLLFGAARMNKETSNIPNEIFYPGDRDILALSRTLQSMCPDKKYKIY